MKNNLFKAPAISLQENVVHLLKIKGTDIDITQTWQLEGPVKAVMHSPDYETLLLPSNAVKP